MFTIYLLNQAENIINMHIKYRQIVKEKQIQTSLFKITHEIKNPIDVCKGYLDMYDENNLEKTKKYIPIIKEEIDRVLILLEDFLSMNKQKINKDILDINKDYIVRTSDKVDTRKKIIKLTDKGVKIVRVLDEDAKEISNLLMIGINKDEYDTFKRVLDKVEMNIERMKI